MPESQALPPDHHAPDASGPHPPSAQPEFAPPAGMQPAAAGRAGLPRARPVAPGPSFAEPGLFAPHVSSAQAAAPVGPLPPVPAGLAVAVIILAAALIAGRVATAASAWLASDDLKTAGELGLTYNETPYLLYDSMVVLHLPVSVAAYVVACLWLQQGRRFSLAVAPQVRHERSAVWVWLGWWVPIVTFWFPYQVVRDVRRATLGAAMTGGMGLWWACWLIPNFIDNAVNGLTGGLLGTGELTPAVAAVPVLETVTALLTTVAGGSWIRYVRELTAAQRAWAAPTQPNLGRPAPA
ncbi:hypothetical protein GCM10028784_16170 [Myceligenerans cantabricum]